MSKSVSCHAKLIAASVLVFAGLAAAQAPQTTFAVQEQIAVRQQPGALAGKVFNLNQKNALQPSYCNPCLFYAGDSDPNSPNWNGIWDAKNDDYFGANELVYTPFAVPKGARWNVAGIIGEIVYHPYPPAVDAVEWSIVKGVAAGGTPASTTVICSGRDTAPVLIDTGRNYQGFNGAYEEYSTIASTAGACPRLKGAGKIYWQTNQVDTHGPQWAYLLNVPDNPPPNAYGPPEPPNKSFVYSYIGPPFTFTVLPGIWSAGIEGTQK